MVTSCHEGFLRGRNSSGIVAGFKTAQVLIVDVKRAVIRPGFPKFAERVPGQSRESEVRSFILKEFGGRGESALPANSSQLRQILRYVAGQAYFQPARRRRRRGPHPASRTRPSPRHLAHQRHRSQHHRRLSRHRLNCETFTGERHNSVSYPYERHAPHKRVRVSAM